MISNGFTSIFILSIILEIFFVSLVKMLVSDKFECKYNVCIVCKFIEPVEVILSPALTITSSFVKPKFLYKFDELKFIVCVVASEFVKVILLVFSL